MEIEPTLAASSWNLRHSVWLLNRYQPHKGGATSFERLTESPNRYPILPLFVMVECLIPSDRNPGGVLVIARGVPLMFRSMWVGSTEESDEHLVVNEIGHVVRVRTVRRCVENENMPTLSSLPQPLRTSSLRETPWKSQRDGRRQKDAEHASQRMQTNLWYDVKHDDTSTVSLPRT